MKDSYPVIDIETFNGTARVVVDALFPHADQGLFPVKTVVGEVFAVEAHLVCDSHDVVRAVLQYRKRGSELWHEVEMRAGDNDEWFAEFTPGEIGFWEYTVEAWVDRFCSWRNGFIKKADSQQDVSVELLIGAELVGRAAERAEGYEKERMEAFAQRLGAEEEDVAGRTELACSGELAALVNGYPDRSRASHAVREHPLLVERERAVFSTWYEFFPRSWGEAPGKHGTFATAMGILPEIARMGFTIVYLPPIHPIGRLFRKGRNNSLTAGPGDVGSPWAIGSEEGGHKSIHAELGTMEDFQRFVERAKELGMEVALDIAFQCAPDHPYVKEHPAWFKWRPDGTVQYAENPPKKYQDILPLYFETDDWKALWEELYSVFEFWIEHGVDVFRVDNPHTKSMEFWRWCVLRMKEKHPQVILLSEAFTRPKRKYRLGKAGFTQGYTYFTWRNNAAELRSYVEELTKAPVKDIFWPNFWPNTPDILHADLQSGRWAAFVARYVLAATLSSNTGIYGPAFELREHEPFPGKEEYNHNEKYEIKNWDWDRPGNLKWLLARLNHVRNTQPCLQRTANIRFVETDNAHFLAYLKLGRAGGDSLLVVVNMDYERKQAGFVDLPLELLGIGEHDGYGVRDLLAEKPHEATYGWRGKRNYVELDPAQKAAHVFQFLR